MLKAIGLAAPEDEESWLTDRNLPSEACDCRAEVSAGRWAGM